MEYELFYKELSAIPSCGIILTYNYLGGERNNICFEAILHVYIFILRYIFNV